MDGSFCLVLTGRFAAGHAPATVQARLARAFGMDAQAFAEQVFDRAPLVIRSGLGQAAASEQSARLLAAGAEADALPDDGGRVWLLRGRRVCGPLPAASLGRYARAGEAWCRDGEQQWQDWEPAAAALPPPLPILPARAPPPLPAVPLAAAAAPATSAAAPRSRRRAAFAVAVVTVALLLAWCSRGWDGRPQPPAITASPRMAAARPAATAWLSHRDRGADHCRAADGAAPDSDEDRFLTAGGHRHLTGRHQRQGDTYVAEAALGFDDACRFDPLQLYVFHRGVLIGTALSKPAWREDGRRILDFALTDDTSLHYRVSDCGNETDCGRTVDHVAQLAHRDFGWSLQRDGSEPPPTPPRVLSRAPPRYPPAALVRRHQGQVLLQVVVGQDGRPGEIRVARSSGYQELDQAAVAAARRWRFQPASRNGKPIAARVRIPVNFTLGRS